jgi:hypothetical protein
VFVRACTGGHLNTAKRWLNKHNIPEMLLMSMTSLKGVYENGHLAVAKWLCEDLGVGVSPAIAKEWPLGMTDDALLKICTVGHVETLKWLYEAHNVRRPMFRPWLMLSVAARGGALPLVQWLVETFDIKAAEYDRHHTPLQAALERGHLEVAKWLYEKYGCRMMDMYDTFGEATCAGHLETLKWMTSVIGVDDLVVRRMLMAASRSGHLDTVKWVCDNFRPPSADHRASLAFSESVSMSLDYAKSNGSEAVVEYLNTVQSA